MLKDDIHPDFYQMIAEGGVLFKRRTDAELCNYLLKEAAMYGIGAAWGVSPISDAIEELIIRYLEAKDG